jgi:hypothetical protein
MGVEAFLIKIKKGPELFQFFIYSVEGIPGDNVGVTVNYHF